MKKLISVFIFLLCSSTAQAIPVYYDFVGTSTGPANTRVGLPDGGQVTGYISFDSSLIAPDITINSGILSSALNVGTFTFIFTEFTALVSSDLQNLTVTGWTRTNVLSDEDYRYWLADRGPALYDHFGLVANALVSGANPELISDVFGTWDLRTAAPVPEPATMLLLSSGLVGLAGFRRKFKEVK